MLQDIPKIGLGTFLQKDQEAFDSVLNGLQVGYRHIDTAQIYENEGGVGRAIAQSGVPRDEIFVTTKVWIENFSKEKFIPSLKESLEKLQMEQVDLTLIHWANAEVPLHVYMELLAQAKMEGLTRLIGVSNFTIDLLEQSFKILGAKEIATNQVEVHPYLQNKKLLDFCKAQNIHITAYMPLARGKVVEDPVIQGIAARHGSTPVDVTLAWLLQQGFAVIPSSKKRANLETNLKSVNLKLDAEDIAKIATLDRGERIVNPDFAPVWDK